MRLADFIDAREEDILTEWVAFAATLLPSASKMNVTTLRDHAPEILRAIAADLRQTQTAADQSAKSQGLSVVVQGSPQTAAEVHGTLRAQVGFSITQLFSEYRAMRATVLRLWMEVDRSLTEATAADDVMRFNEAIDQAVAESINFFSQEFFQDSAARVAVDRELALNRGRLEYASRLSNVGFWYCDLPFDVLEWDNQVKEHFFFLPSARISINDFYDRIHPEDREPTRVAIEASIGSRNAYDIVYRTVHPLTSEIKWIRALGGTNYASDGSPIHFDGLTVDVTAQKIAEKRAAESEAREERDRLWRNTQDLQVIIDSEGRFLDVNPAFTNILGWTIAELVGKTVFDLIIPDEGATQNALEHARDQTLMAFENRYRHKYGGFRWFSWVATPQAGLIYASARHITAEKEQAEALRMAEAALRQSQKMEAVGQLTGGLAHDFNNLLAGISGALELMQIRMRQGRLADVERYMSVAQSAGKRAAALTHRLLAFSRRQTLSPVPTDVNRLAQGMEELIQRTVGPMISVEVVGASGAWPTLVDPSQLENALLNLCINARDAMPEGGKITIETANKWFDVTAALQHQMPEGQYLSLCVSDTGTGMTPEVVVRAFEPFFTTKPIGEGTGLGLSMIYGFVQQSGGQVRIYSEIDQGSTVCLYLPRHYGEATDHLPEEHSVAIARSKYDKLVLVVDDEPTVRLLMVDILEELGFRTAEASDSAAGLKILQSDLAIDLLVTDVGLPGGMNGRQMADAARVHRPNLKVLFITGYAENAIFGNGLLTPGMAVVTKPFSLEAMKVRLHTIIHEG